MWICVQLISNTSSSDDGAYPDHSNNCVLVKLVNKIIVDTSSVLSPSVQRPWRPVTAVGCFPEWKGTTGTTWTSWASLKGTYCSRYECIYSDTCTTHLVQCTSKAHVTTNICDTFIIYLYYLHFLFVFLQQAAKTCKNMQIRWFRIRMMMYSSLKICNTVKHLGNEQHVSHYWCF